MKPREEIVNYLRELKEKYKAGAFINYDTPDTEIMKIKGYEWKEIQLWSYAAAWLYEEEKRGKYPKDINLGLLSEEVEYEIEDYTNTIANYNGYPVEDVVAELEKIKDLLNNLVGV